MSPSHRKPPPAAAAGGVDAVECSTETAASAAAALAEMLGIKEEEAWDLINRAASGDAGARSTIAATMEPVTAPAPATQSSHRASTAPVATQDKARPSTSPHQQLMRGDMVVIDGCDRDQNVVLVEGFLSDEEIAYIDATPSMAESIEAGPDGTFNGLVGGNRYTDETGLSIFGSAKHRSWRIEDALTKQSARLVERLSTAMAAVDSTHWGSLTQAERVQFMCEIEYICYDASVPGSRPNLAPHVDNGAKVTIVALLVDENDFDGGTNFFGGGCNGGARSHRMKRGDAIFFRGECVEHWISHVERGKRSILQVELHLHPNKAAAELVNAAAQMKKEGNQLHKDGDMRGALASYDKAIGMLIHAEQEHSSNFGAHLEVKKIALSCACLLNAAACTLRLGEYQRAVENCNAVLTFEPQSAKALFRRAQAYEQLGNKAGAEADLVEGMRIKPSDTAISTALAALRGESSAAEAATAKEQRRRKTSGGAGPDNPLTSASTDATDSSESASSSTLLAKVKTGIAKEIRSNDLQNVPHKQAHHGSGAPKGFNGGSFITANALAKAGITNDPQPQQPLTPSPQKQQQQQPSAGTSPSSTIDASTRASAPAAHHTRSSIGTTSSRGCVSPPSDRSAAASTATDASTKAPALPTHRRCSSTGSTGSRGSVSPPSDRSAAGATSPTVPKVKPKPRVPSPTPASEPATQEAKGATATGPAGRPAGAAAPLGIATELLAAFDGDFSKAVECLLTAHKFA